MDKLYEIEIQRTNVSPKQFFTYCKSQMKKRAGIELESWCESFEEWIDERINYNASCYHDDWDDPVEEICKTMPYNWQMFLGKAHNFIFEFDFDTEKIGHGYLYAVEFKR